MGKHHHRKEREQRDCYCYAENYTYPYGMCYSNSRRGYRHHYPFNGYQISPGCGVGYAYGFPLTGYQYVGYCC